MACRLVLVLVMPPEEELEEEELADELPELAMTCWWRLARWWCGCWCGCWKEGMSLLLIGLSVVDLALGENWASFLG